MAQQDKKIKVLWSINVLTEIDSQAYPSHLVHAYRMGRDTDVEFMLHTPRRMPIAAGRNSAVEVALTNDCDYILFTDDDMELHPQAFKTLLSRDRDIVMAMCYIRGYPYRPMVFKWFEGEETQTSVGDQKVKGRCIGLWSECEQHIQENGLIEPVAAVGCATTLVKTDLLRKMNFPWFYTGTANTEDVYFCIKAQNVHPDVTIAVDTTIPSGHVLKDKSILYPWNAETLRQFNKDMESVQRQQLEKEEVESVAHN